jgi:hypothetical protein
MTHTLHIAIIGAAGWAGAQVPMVGELNPRPTHYENPFPCRLWP